MESAELEKTVGKEYLEKIIKLCQDNEIEVMICLAPYVTNKKEQERSNGISQIDKRYNIKYFNGLYGGIVDFQTDMYDRGYLNYLDANKWTKALGSYIKENYNIQDHTGDSRFADWNDDYQKYKEKNIEVMRQQTDFHSYIMLLKRPWYEVYISINEQSEIYKDEKAIKLINNLGKFDGLEEAREKGDKYIGTNNEKGEFSS